MIAWNAVGVSAALGMGAGKYVGFESRLFPDGPRLVHSLTVPLLG